MKIIMNVFILVHVMVSAFDDNQRLGDIKEYDCTLGYRYSGVIVQWKEYKSDQVLNNPLLLTIDQSMNNSYYTCNATINNNPASCELQQAHVTIKVKGTSHIAVYIFIFHSRNFYKDSGE